MTSREEKSFLPCIADVACRQGMTRTEIPGLPVDTELDKQALLAQALLDPAVYPDAPTSVDKLETHISYVFLAGPHAYKMKKAVDLGFLDFRTLAARSHYCREELRLNRRLAPHLYLGIVAVTGSAEHPILGGDGPAIEYVVKMRRFPQEDLADRMLDAGQLTAAHIDRLAYRVAEFHGSAMVAETTDTFGTPAAIQEPALQNLSQLRAVFGRSPELPDLDYLEAWTRYQCKALEASFRTRKAAGSVRECHGDLHLGNIALIDGELLPFDCLEFNENLRWIDVMSDVAFLMMDLDNRKRPDLARRFINRYLERTSDYAGLRVLRFYAVYRALVRVKISCLQANQPSIDATAREQLRTKCRRYLALARRYTVEPRPAVVITHGISGSGKTTVAQSFVEAVGAVRVRSDIERKRLHSLHEHAITSSELADGIYKAEATARTYEVLLSLTKAIVEAGYVAVIDAAFLKHTQRDAFRRLAVELRMPFLILNVDTDEAAARARVSARQRQGGDASEADSRVLEHQLRTRDPLQADERSAAVVVQTDRPDDIDWSEALEKLRRLGT